ncbi:hypothetical protein JCM3774_002492 [Rhodotorula dairenensis]
MATSPPASTAHDRSALPATRLPTSSPTPAATAPSQQPTSALSASLKAFRELAVSHKGTDSLEPQHPFASDEFKQAYHHARRTSFGNQTAQQPADRSPTVNKLSPGLAVPAAAAVPALSTSPSASSDAGTSAGSSLTTPPSSSPPPAKARALSQPSTSNGNGASGNGNGSGSLKAKKPSSTLRGVCEGPEIALENGQLGLSDEDLLGVPVASSASTVTGSPSSVQTGAGSGMFAGGAKWGWTSSPSAVTSPGATSMAMTSPPLASAGAAFSPMSLPGPGAFVPGGDGDVLSPGQQRRRGSVSFAAPVHSASSSSSSAGTVVPIPSPSNGVTSPLATSPPTNDPFRLMQPLGRVVSAGAALQTPNAASPATASGTKSSGAADGFGLFRRFSIGGLGARKTRNIPQQPPSPPSGFQQHQPAHQLGGSGNSANLPAPTLLEPTHASLSPATISTTEAKGSAKPPVGPSPAARGRTLAPAGVGGTGNGGVKARKLSPMGERILRGGY